MDISRTKSSITVRSRNIVRGILTPELNRNLQHYMDTLINGSGAKQGISGLMAGKVKGRSRKEVTSYINQALGVLQKSPVSETEIFFKKILSNTSVRTIFLNEVAAHLMKGQKISIAVIDAIIARTVTKAKNTKGTSVEVQSFFAKYGVKIAVKATPPPTPAPDEAENLRRENPLLYEKYQGKHSYTLGAIMPFDLYIQMDRILSNIGENIRTDFNLGSIMISSTGYNYPKESVESIVQGIINLEMDKLEPPVRKYFMELFDLAGINEAIENAVKYEFGQRWRGHGLNDISRKIRIEADKKLWGFHGSNYSEARAKIGRTLLEFREPPPPRREPALPARTQAKSAPEPKQKYKSGRKPVIPGDYGKLIAGMRQIVTPEMYAAVTAVLNKIIDEDVTKKVNAVNADYSAKIEGIISITDRNKIINERNIKLREIVRDVLDLTKLESVELANQAEALAKNFLIDILKNSKTRNPYIVLFNYLMRDFKKNIKLSNYTVNYFLSSAKKDTSLGDLTILRKHAANFPQPVPDKKMPAKRATKTNIESSGRSFFRVEGERGPKIRWRFKI